jgi:hypothetical protein
LNFELLLVLIHDDVIWDCPKKQNGKRKIILKHTIWRKMGGIVGTCSKKTIGFVLIHNRFNLLF